MGVTDELCRGAVRIVASRSTVSSSPVSAAASSEVTF